MDMRTGFFEGTPEGIAGVRRAIGVVTAALDSSASLRSELTFVLEEILGPVEDPAVQHLVAVEVGHLLAALARLSRTAIEKRRYLAEIDDPHHLLQMYGNALLQGELHQGESAG